MPARIVLDNPDSHPADAILGLAGRFAGVFAVLVGVIASVVAVPTSFFALGLFIGVLSGSSTETDGWPPEDMPVGLILAAWAISTPVAFVGLRYGLRLIRGRRSTVLYLRRFGYTESSQVVTFAAATALGASWRLVTLDDASIAPLGIPTGTRRLFTVGSRVRHAVFTSVQFLGMTIFPIIPSLMMLLIGLEFLLADDWRAVPTDGTLDPYVEIFASLMEARIPSSYFDLSLPGTFAVLGSVALVTFGMLALMFIALLLAFPFAVPLLLVTFSSGAAQQAEGSKAMSIKQPSEVQTVAHLIFQKGRAIFAPRLVVVRVVTPLWQQTVTALASICPISIIDVSEPTENLAWELAELERLFGDQYIVIGERDRVERWASAPPAPYAPASLDARVADWLDGRVILAYTTDRAGMRRFARALGRTLLSLSRDAAAASRPRLRDNKLHP